MAQQRLRVRRLTDEEGRQLQRVVRRGGGKTDKSIVKWRRSMVVLASAGGNIVEAIVRLVQTSPDRVLALHQAAAHTDHTIVVTDNVYPGLEDPDDPVVRFGMDSENRGPSVRWWDLSPGPVTRMLWRLGFERTRLIHHVQRFEVPDPPVDIRLFTVVVSSRRAHRD